MKTLTLKPDTFEIELYETTDKKSDFESDPHPYGFYHYPDNIKDRTAFNRLRKAMIKDREYRIDLLKSEITKLKGLKYED